MLHNCNVATRLPAHDLERARAFYAERLGLEPLEERPGGLKYKCGNGYFALFESAGAPSGEHTQMAWEVDDLDAVMSELRRRGVVFEEYDLPELALPTGLLKCPVTTPLPVALANVVRGFAIAKGIY